jgi:hypothetical protein
MDHAYAYRVNPLGNRKQLKNCCRDVTDSGKFWFKDREPYQRDLHKKDG